MLYNKFRSCSWLCYCITDSSEIMVAIRFIFLCASKPGMVTRIPTRHQGMFYVSVEILYKIMSYFMSIDQSLFNPATTTNYEAKNKEFAKSCGSNVPVKEKIFWKCCVQPIMFYSYNTNKRIISSHVHDFALDYKVQI